MIDMGKIAYDVYREKAGGRSLVTDDPLPYWHDLSPRVRACWDAAALAVAEFVGSPSTWRREEEEYAFQLGADSNQPDSAGEDS